MRRKSLLLMALLVVLAVSRTQTAEAATLPTLGRYLDAQTIKAALKTATPEEDGFIQYVVDRVSAGKLPENLVVSTFLWARNKPRRQFQYFKYGLIIRARRSGIRL